MSVPISIIMTVYNRERYVGAAIKSVLAQTRKDFELIVWDDGSTDGSLEIALAFAKEDKRVLVTAAEHQGRVLALKAAHAQASGKYLGWVDSDDLLAPTALEQTEAILDRQPDVGLIYTDHLIIDEQEQVRGYGECCRIPYSFDRLLLDFITFHFRLFRRDVFDAAGGINCSFSAAIDYDLCLRLSEVTQVFHLAKPLYYYRQHRGSMSYQQRIEQILASKEAITRALERRGMSACFEVELQITGKYFLRSK